MKGTLRPDIGSGGLGEHLERYPVTFGVLGANLVLYLFAVFQGSSLALGPELELRLGANYFELVASQPWRLITSTFLHADLLHFALNSVALFFVGRLIEIHYGWARTFVLYVAFALASSLGSAGWSWLVVKSKISFLHPGGVSVGASGAIFGLILLGYVYARAEAHRLGSIARQLQSWIIVILVFSFLFPGVDVAGHLCGAAAGAVVGTQVQPRPGEDPHPAWRHAAIGLAFLCLACFACVVWAMRTGRDLG